LVSFISVFLLFLMVANCHISLPPRHFARHPVQCSTSPCWGWSWRFVSLHLGWTVGPSGELKAQPSSWVGCRYLIRKTRTQNYTFLVQDSYSNYGVQLFQ
jgi:hypothetical protein